MSPTKMTFLLLSMRTERLTELLALGRDGTQIPLDIVDEFVLPLKEVVDQYLAERVAENN